MATHHDSEQHGLTHRQQVTNILECKEKHGESFQERALVGCREIWKGKLLQPPRDLWSVLNLTEIPYSSLHPWAAQECACGWSKMQLYQQAYSVAKAVYTHRRDLIPRLIAISDPKQCQEISQEMGQCERMAWKRDFSSGIIPTMIWIVKAKC